MEIEIQQSLIRPDWIEFFWHINNFHIFFKQNKIKSKIDQMVTYPITKGNFWRLGIDDTPQRPEEVGGQREHLHLPHHLVGVLSWAPLVQVGSNECPSLFLGGIVRPVLLVEGVVGFGVVVGPFDEVVGDVEGTVIVRAVFEIWDREILISSVYQKRCIILILGPLV